MEDYDGMPGFTHGFKRGIRAAAAGAVTSTILVLVGSIAEVIPEAEIIAVFVQVLGLIGLFKLMDSMVYWSKPYLMGFLFAMVVLLPLPGARSLLGLLVLYSLILLYDKLNN